MKIDPELRSWATARQLEFIDAIEKHGSMRKASRALGLNKSRISIALVSLKRRASLQGYAPKHDMTKPAPAPFVVRGVSTYYDKDGNKAGQWVKTKLDDSLAEQAIRDFVESLVEDARGLSPIVPAPAHCNDDLLCVYPIGDPHFGMYSWSKETGEDFDTAIAERLMCSAIDRLVDSAPPAATAVLLNLGDMLHADNQTNTSKSGHQLDVDGRWTKVLQVGLRAKVYGIKRLLEKHQRVIVRINQGNHDGHSSFALSLALDAYFSNEPRVEIDLSPSPMWYFLFGSVLIGSTHGDTVKGPSLPGVMACDRPHEWGISTHRVWYVGHIHHSDLKDYPGVTVEYFRTMAARDAWHHRQGYRAGRDMRMIVLHAKHGEIERHRCDVGMLA